MNEHSDETSSSKPARKSDSEDSHAEPTTEDDASTKRHSSSPRGAWPEEESEGTDPSNLPGEIPLGVWSMLQAPFDQSDVQLDDVQVDSKNGRGLGRPVVDESALISRLNRILGPEGWSLEFSDEGAGTYHCRLHIGSAFRDGIAQGRSPLASCLQALRVAMRGFGIGVGLHGPPNIYVEKDAQGHISNFQEIISELADLGAVKPSGSA